MRRTSLYTPAVAVLAALAVPAAASAALPTPSTATIVPRTSIGGVALGTSQTRVFRLWGAGECITQPVFNGRTCVWHEPRTMTLPPQGTVVQFRGGTLCHVAIQAGVALRGGALRITRLRNWKTRDGIGLGSSISAVRRAYGSVFLRGPRGAQFTFSAGVDSSTRSKVAKMVLWRAPCRPTA